VSEAVQTVERALTILEVLSDYPDGLRITEISAITNLHKSTVHRLLGSLMQNGYVKQNLETSKYQLTFKLFELGSKKIKSMDIVSAAKHHISTLNDKTNEVIHLVVPEGAEVIYVYKAETLNTIRMHSYIGMKSPMYCTAVGKAILASLSPSEIMEIWEKSTINKNTPNTITDLDDLMKELELVKAQGYAVDKEENELGVTCIGTAIFDYTGAPNAAISISGPTSRITGEKMQSFAKLLIETSEQISNELGYRK